MFQTLLHQDVTAERKGQFASASWTWLLAFLAVAGCQPDAADRPTAANVPKPRKELQILGICGRVAFSPDGHRLVGDSSSHDTGGIVVDAQTGKELLTLPEREVPIRCVAYSPDGKLIAWGLLGKSSLHFRGFSAPDNPKDLLFLTDSATGKTIRTFPSQLDAVSQVMFSPDGKLMASANENIVRLWDVATGKEVRVLQGHTDDVLDIAFSPDGKQLASTGNDNTVRMWDLESGTLLTTIASKDTAVLDRVAFHPGGRMLASGGSRVNERSKMNEITVNLWDLNDPTKGATLRGHKDETIITGLVFHPDGRHLFSLDEDGVVCVWDITTRKRIYSLTNNKPALGFAVSPDGTHLVVSHDSEHPAIVWDLRPHDKGKP